MTTFIYISMQGYKTFNGSKGRTRREHRLERSLKQVQKTGSVTCKKRLMALLNTFTEKEKQLASKKEECPIK